MKFILGKKIKMSQIFDKKGKVIPVTLIEAGPCVITQIKTKERGDNYEAVQIGFGKIEKKNKIKKTMKGKEYRYLKEYNIRYTKYDIRDTKIGDKIDVSIFEQGDIVKISGISKGKGFQGGVKKWGFHGKSKTHGTKHEERTIGSVGATGPERVFKGRKMPGRMGAERKTVKNLEIIKIDKKNNLLAVKGAVPGRRGTLLEIRG